MTEIRKINDTQFYTAAELADHVKMNHQVILRKLQSGEIAGYKIGKEWRITDIQIWAWLEKRSNRPSKLSEKGKTLKTFFIDGKLTGLPSQRKRRQFVLEYLLKDFQPNRLYAEAEVNEIIRKYHPDFATIRREFIVFKMMNRTGGIYKLNSVYQMSPGK
ncbi:MAG: DUF2087 domain-containing protein [candidate division Zixibacteria bacterium]|nr:DUF2087 domain-containing protein [candidate division Zixibacteria bacterium]